MKGVFLVLVAVGAAVACSGEVNLDAPAWPAVKPECWPDARKKSVGTHPAKDHTVCTFEWTVPHWGPVTFVGNGVEFEEFSL